MTNPKPLFTAEDFAIQPDFLLLDHEAARIANAKRDAEIERLRDERSLLKIRVQDLERTVGILNGTLDALRAASADIYRKQESEIARLREALELLASECDPNAPISIRVQEIARAALDKTKQ